MEHAGGLGAGGWSGGAGACASPLSAGVRCLTALSGWLQAVRVVHALLLRGWRVGVIGSMSQLGQWVNGSIGSMAAQSQTCT